MGRLLAATIGLWTLAMQAQTLPLPARPRNAPDGRQLSQQLAVLEWPAREDEIFTQVVSGNVPGFLRKFRPICVTNVSDGLTNTATYYAAPDYLALGSDDDYLLMPISPNMAQRLADTLHCTLPTRQMVNQIYAAAEVKLAPTPIPPSPAMTSVAVFSNHNAIVWRQRSAQFEAHPLGALVAGHKKDVVISPRLGGAPGKVAIYGWHQTNGVPIQNLYLGHTAAWVDYSQCTRLVQQQMIVNGSDTTVAEVLANHALAGLLSDEGVVATPRYPTNKLSSAPATRATGANAPAEVPVASAPGNNTRTFAESGVFHERVASFTIEPEVKVLINAPPPQELAARQSVRLIFYALPNGNTTAQTIGHSLKPGDDWHYNIQHLGAQTRFLRQILTNDAVVVAYLEAAQKSWPSWRKAHGDKLIPQIIAQVKDWFAGSKVETVLSGHSGGGSFIFGYLNAVERIPDDVGRIAFLDSDYAYDRALKHDTKLAQWLQASGEHRLCVLAYDDAAALLNGKSFVTPAGGTWGRSHAMQRDLAEVFAFTSQTNAPFEYYNALQGRVQFILRENPTREVLHTVQVERNGFIHAMLTGTASESRGYEYFGARAYEEWISKD
jgi:hypothetical protein